MGKPTRSEELAELMFRERNEKQIQYARERYEGYAFLLSNAAYEIGLTSKEDYPMIKRFMTDLEMLFGKEAFKGIHKPI